MESCFGGEAVEALEGEKVVLDCCLEIVVWVLILESLDIGGDPFGRELNRSAWKML